MLGSALCKACSCRAKSAVPFECAVRDNEIDEIGRDDQIARPRCRWPSGSIRFLTSSPVSCRKAVADLRQPIPGRDRMLATIPARRSAWTENSPQVLCRIAGQADLDPCRRQYSTMRRAMPTLRRSISSTVSPSLIVSVASLQSRTNPRCRRL